jgi:glutamyl-tRNA reductase
VRSETSGMPIEKMNGAHPTGPGSGLMIIGISHHTAPVEIREKFALAESQLYPALHCLRRSPGIEEVVALSTCNRTEFVLWCSHFSSASASIRDFLAARHGLHSVDWSSFYHVVKDEALAHLFRVTSSLDSLVVGEPQITGQMKSAWLKAQQAGSCGPFLAHALQKALNVSKRVRNETAIGSAPVSVPYTAAMLAREIFGSLENTNVMIIGSGKMSKVSARSFLSAGVKTIWITNRRNDHALQLAEELGGVAVKFEERLPYLSEADIIVSSTGCPHIVFDREDAERIREFRRGRPVVLIDIAVPRDIEPAVRDVPGFYLYDIDDLERVVARNLEERRDAAAEAEKIIARETHSFRQELESQRVVPTIVAFRARLEEFRRAEMAQFDAQSRADGMTDREAADLLSARLMDRIAGELARELKQVSDRPSQETLASAIRRLFRVAPNGTGEETEITGKSNARLDAVQEILSAG